MTEGEAARGIADGLASLGVRRGGVVLVHSSLRSLGPVPGGAETVVRGLWSALGPEGTLLMPALSYAHVDAARPVFDVVRTPSNVGWTAEYFRRRAGTMRSVNPTHSVCGAGVRAREMLGEHHLDETPCGVHSPYRKLRDAGGQIVFLGCGLRPNTSMHGVEELVEPPYLFGEMASYRVILADGSERRMRCRQHDFRGWAQRYDRIGELLRDEGLRAGQVLSATVDVVECGRMWARAESALRRNVFHFVDRKE